MSRNYRGNIGVRNFISRYGKDDNESLDLRNYNNYEEIDDMNENGSTPILNFFKKKNLKNINFSHHIKDLSNKDLSNKILNNSNFEKVKCYKTKFYKSKCILCNFKNAILEKTNFIDSKCMEADFTGAVLNRTLFSFANLSNSKLCHIKKNDADFNGAILYGADLRSANFEDSNLNNADLNKIIINFSTKLPPISSFTNIQKLRNYQANVV